MKPKTWQILGFADVISMTTGPLSSCELCIKQKSCEFVTKKQGLLAWPVYGKTKIKFPFEILTKLKLK